jgi:hypothetical protein
MRNFVSRFQYGPVRKLFRRIDRQLHPWYPEGLTLTGLLDGVGVSKHPEGSPAIGHNPGSPGVTDGQAAFYDEESPVGQVPVVVAAGEVHLNEVFLPGPTGEERT